MINSIKDYNANIKIIINLIIPCQPDQDKFAQTDGYGTMPSWISKRNTYFANLNLLEKYKDTENVNLSWYNAAIDIYTNMQNDVHRTIAGYEQLGEQMYYFLKSIS